MERPRFGLFSSVGMAIAAAFGGFAGMPKAEQADARRSSPTRSTEPRRERRARPMPSMRAADDYLGKRTLLPDRASNVRKLQRAFRLAGKSFTPGRG